MTATPDHHVVVTFTLPASPDYTTFDVHAAVLARLDEIYPDDAVVPQQVHVSVTTAEARKFVADALEVAIYDDGAPDAFDVLATLSGRGQ